MGSLLAPSHQEDSGVVAPVSCHARPGGIFLEALPVPKPNPTPPLSLWMSSPAGRGGDVVRARGDLCRSGLATLCPIPSFCPLLWLPVDLSSAWMQLRVVALNADEILALLTRASVRKILGGFSLIFPSAFRPLSFIHFQVKS